MLFMGSGFEVLFPLAVGAYFLVRKRDLVSGSGRLGMGGERPGQCRYLHRRRRRRSAGAAGSHRARCRRRLGADPGVEFFDKVYLADGIAGVVRTVGFVLWGVALCLAVWAIVRNRHLTGGRSRSEGTGDRGASTPPSRSTRRTCGANPLVPGAGRVGVRCCGPNPRERRMAGSTVVVEWLRQVPLFSACSARELRAIAGVVKEVDHPRGTVIATEGSRCRIVRIVDGEAEVTIGGKRMAILRRGTSSVIALLDGGPVPPPWPRGRISGSSA